VKIVYRSSTVHNKSKQDYKVGMEMTDSWQCDTCGRNFTNTKGRIKLTRKFAMVPIRSSTYPIETMTQETYSPKI
jgi:hypothetical protein